MPYVVSSETDTELDKDVTEEDWTIIFTIVQRSKQTAHSTDDDPSSSNAMAQILIAMLPQMSPRLTLKLRRAKDMIPPSSSSTMEEQRNQPVTVGNVLVRVLSDGPKFGKETPSTPIDAREVRKLDSEIGQVLRQGRLDMAFFKVQ